MKRTPFRAKIVRKSKLREQVLERDQGICAVCGRYDPRWHHDHRQPLSMGGADDLNNSQTLCRACHSRKTAGEAAPRAKADRCRARHQLTALRKPSRGPSDAGAQADAASTRRDQGP